MSKPETCPRCRQRFATLVDGGEDGEAKEETEVEAEMRSALILATLLISAAASAQVACPKFTRSDGCKRGTESWASGYIAQVQSDGITLQPVAPTSINADDLGSSCTDAEVLGGDGAGGTECQADVDTTCNDAGVTCLFAGSATEGGAATTALALDANPSDCGAGQYARGVDASGNAEDCTADVGANPAGSGRELQFRSSGTAFGAAGLSIDSTDTTEIDSNASIRFQVDANNDGTEPLGVADSAGDTFFSAREDGLLSLTGTAPAISVNDSTASAKDLYIAVDANVAEIRELAGAANSLLALDLANNTVGIRTAASTTDFFTIASTDTAGVEELVIGSFVIDKTTFAITDIKETSSAMRIFVDNQLNFFFNSDTAADFDFAVVNRNNASGGSDTRAFTILGADNNVGLGDTSPAARLTVVGHQQFQGTAPTLSACGTTPTVTSNSTDSAGRLTTGTGSPTACTITFNSSWTAAPSCVLNNQTSATVTRVTSTSTTAVTITFAAGCTSCAVDWICFAFES